MGSRVVAYLDSVGHGVKQASILALNSPCPLFVTTKIDSEQSGHCIFSVCNITVTLFNWPRK